jgi:hypothetical protein
LNNVLESYLALAFALRATPGAYAVLLGAGVSISAGMPAAWDVQQQLISDLARAQGEEPDVDRQVIPWGSGHGFPSPCVRCMSSRSCGLGVGRSVLGEPGGRLRGRPR